MPTDPSSSFITNTRQEGNAVFADVACDVTTANTPQVREDLMELVAAFKPAPLILDMHAVGYMDSSGLATLVEIKRALGEHELVLMDLSKEVKGLMKIMNLHLLFRFADDQADALNRAGEA